LNDINQPLKKRFRALFTLRNLGGQQSIELINKAIQTDESVLLKHECCYCLGQMGDKRAIDYLVNILENKEENEIVRHEAGEALGNLLQNNEHKDQIEKLRSNLNDKSVIVSQTCELALDVIEWRATRRKGEVERYQALNPYQSKDPTPSFELDTSLDGMVTILFNKAAGLFNMYRCLFTLRNRGTPTDVHVLGKTLINYKGQDDMSLFKHEIGYIFGQMQSPHSISYLKEMVECETENDIVRHECAEALGSIATPESLDFLKKYLNDDSLVVRQSCEVALDMIDYETDDKQFNFIEQ
jgi:deoxyhypusine monooxygenase